MDSFISSAQFIAILTISFNFPSFIVNALLLLIPHFRNYINSSFLYGGFIGIVLGGIIGLVSLSGLSRLDLEFLIIYTIGLVFSLYILIPHILIYYLNKKSKNINNTPLFSAGCLLYTIETLAAFALLNKFFH